ncbi:DUF3888 domain-containing protein [Bacillus fungorum]|uniref:DUF3888 domain-containing protein n=1 Tax=Bacillus fungorum TaxID=2039284 RepID=UPI003F552903
MKKFLCIIFSVLFCITTSTVLAKQEAPNQEFNDKYDITIQIITYEGPMMPPYGFDTITLQIPGFKVIKYEHKDVSDIGKIPLETH